MDEIFSYMDAFGIRGVHSISIYMLVLKFAATLIARHKRREGEIITLVLVPVTKKYKWYDSLQMQIIELVHL